MYPNNKSKWLLADGKSLYSKGPHQARKVEQQNAHRQEPTFGISVSCSNAG